MWDVPEGATLTIVQKSVFDQKALRMMVLVFNIKESYGAIYFDMLSWVIFVSYLRRWNQF